MTSWATCSGLSKFADDAIDLIEHGATKQIVFSHDAIWPPRGMTSLSDPLRITHLRDDDTRFVAIDAPAGFR